ncbi:MAG: YopX family protein [Clostridium sp.]|nr:YopX family protein [Clostridium sp.]
MNRKIKFRGQTRRKGEYFIGLAGDKCNSNWVYGGIFPQNDGGDFAFIYQQEPEVKKCVVYADTVGQYIGLRDKYGKEIYEGDIVVIDCCEDGYFVVEYNRGQAMFVMTGYSITVDFDTYYSFYVEVVGNIFDNAELINEK